MHYAPSKDRNGRDLHPGDRVRFKTYPKGSAEGVVVISKRTLEVLPDGKTAPALAIESDGTTYGMPPPQRSPQARNYPRFDRRATRP
jgi:hypothetical protein